VTRTSIGSALPASRAGHLVAGALLVLLPLAAEARFSLLDETLPAPQLDAALAAAPDLAVRPVALLATADAKGGQAKADEKKKTSEKKGDAAKPAPGSLDFDLLGAAEPPPDAPDQDAMRLRRKMLGAHQAIGIGLFALQLGTTAVGQANYSDKFSNGPNTGKYQTSHAALAYTNLAVFAVNGAIALFAPSPVKKPMQMDRVMIHRISMATATAGMLAQAGLGIYTSSREGYLNQEHNAQIHLALGYVTLAAMAVGVGALVF
jgi:hypothetical protein